MSLRKRRAADGEGIGEGSFADCQAGRRAGRPSKGFCTIVPFPFLSFSCCRADPLKRTRGRAQPKRCQLRMDARGRRHVHQSRIDNAIRGKRCFALAHYSISCVSVGEANPGAQAPEPRRDERKPPRLAGGLRAGAPRRGDFQGERVGGGVQMTARRRRSRRTGDSFAGQEHDDRIP